ncbi:hypothetical protein A9G06_20875 [Aeromonas sp. DNP9]|nr:hypothetical protein A9G06_20875 [Aeromonas sp. DNP9]
MRIKPKKLLVRAKPEPLVVPDQPNQCWLMDFMHDQLSDGRSTHIDECIVPHVGTGAAGLGGATILLAVSASELAR